MAHFCSTGRLLPARLLVLCVVSTCVWAAPAQAPASKSPNLVRFSGTLGGNGGKSQHVISVTFAIYVSQTGGTPLWTESQNLVADESGKYQVLLGSTTEIGLPSDLFNSGEARWLGVRSEGDTEQPRILLVSVPYAMKAGDADTLGGLPSSAYALAPRRGQKQSRPETMQTINNGGGDAPGTLNMVPKFDSVASIVDSSIFDNGTSVGIGTTTPDSQYKLEINGDIKANNVMYNATDNAFDRGNQTLDCGFGSHTVHVTGTFTTFGGGGWDGFRGETNHPCGNAMEGVASSLFGPVYGVYGQTFADIGSGVVGESNDTSGAGVSYGVQGWIDGPKGIAVLGLQNDSGTFPPAAMGDVIAIEGLVNNANSIAGVFDNTAGGTVFSGRQNGTENININSNGNVTTGGSVTASSFVGNGAGLTNISAGSLSGTANISITGSAVTLAANGANCASGTYSAGIDASGNSEGCSSDGSQLISLNAGQLSSGILPSARLAGTYSAALALTNITNSFTGASAAITAAGTGAAITGANTGAAAGSNGIVGSTQSTTFPSYGVFGLAASANTVAAGFRNTGGGTAIAVLDAVTGVPVFTISGTGAISGSGAGISNLNAGNLFFGTVPSARVSGTYSNALIFSNASNSFTGNGSGLTSLNASQLTSGTVPNAQLSGTYSSPVVFNNSSNGFIGSTLSISGTVTAGAQLNQGAANRWAGTLSISADTSSSVSFVTPYATSPVCTLTPMSDPGDGVRYWVSVTPTAITANTNTVVTMTFNYTCIGNPN
jgi:hypothetical protein